MPQPSEPTICDVYGCGMPASLTTDGTEVDAQKTFVPLETPDEDEPLRGKKTPLARPALPHLNVCDRHRNWPHSEDAQRFVDGTELHEDKVRKAAIKGVHAQRAKLAAAQAAVK